MNPLGVAAVIGSLMAFAAMHRVLRSTSKPRKTAACIALALLSIPAVLFAAYYLHVLPEHAWFYELRAIPGSELSAIFIGAAGGAMASLLPRIALMLPLLGSILITALPYFKMAINPLPLSELQERWVDDVCFQSSASTCGPASTAMVLRSFGVNATEREIAQAAYTSSTGTEAWYLARHVRARGLKASFNFRPTFAVEAGVPAIIGVKISGFGHFIAILSATADTITYADPVRGKRTVSLAEFHKAYRSTGFHLVVSR